MNVVLKQLVGALSKLTLGVELEATAKDVQFVLVRDASVLLSAVELLTALVIQFVPNDAFASKLGLMQVPLSVKV